MRPWLGVGVALVAMTCLASSAAGRDLPWSPWSASILADPLGQVGGGSQTRLDVALGRVDAIADLHAMTGVARRVQARFAADVALSTIAAAAGRESAFRVASALAVAPRLVCALSVGGARTVVGSAVWGSAPAWEAGVAFRDASGTEGGWCRVAGAASAIDERAGLGSGLWWGAPGSARLAVEARVFARDHVWSGIAAAEVPCGERCTLRTAGSTNPGTWSLGVEWGRGRMRLSCERIVGAAVGGGTRATCSWITL